MGSALVENGTNNLSFLQNIGSNIVEWIGSFLLKSPSWGALSISFPNGHIRTIGNAKSKNHAYLKLNNFKVISQIKRRGTLGFAHSYINGDVESDDLTLLFKFFLMNRDIFNKAGLGLIKRAASDLAYHLSRANSRTMAKENISEHYDLGNEFYSLWLDKTMTYSSAIFSSKGQSLEQAQIKKYHHIAKAVGVKKGNSVLEIGSGWGGFAQVIAKDYQTKIRGISLSKQQLKFAKTRIRQQGLDDLASFHFEDYRDSKGKYDHVCSIEMIEAVGEENWHKYFKAVHDRLKQGGTAAIQAITIAQSDFEDYKGNPDFIQRYIFPGGMLLTKDNMRQQGERAGLKLEGQELFGKSYAKTLRIWRENFIDKWSKIKELGFDEKFKRKWIYYLSYCEAGFLEGMIDVGIYQYRRI